jgi:hypothetical protein
MPYMDVECARVRLSESHAVEMGERFVVQVKGGSRVTSFVGDVIATEEGEVVLRVQGEVRCVSPMDPPRVALRRLTGRVTWGGGEAVGEVVDASERGAGLLLPRGIAEGAWVSIQVESDLGTVVVKGEVRYCRPLDVLPGQYRVGVQLAPSEEASASRWGRLIAEDLPGRQAA